VSKTLITSFVAVLLTTMTASSHGDPRPSLPKSSAPEPITGTAVMPEPGSEMPTPDRFAPHDPGPPESLWKYEDLTPAERRVVDRGRDTAAWRGVHDAYRAAIVERQPKLRAQIAASQLGAHDLMTLGVVR
jgi:hypothetical protein